MADLQLDTVRPEALQWLQQQLPSLTPAAPGGPLVPERTEVRQLFDEERTEREDGTGRRLGSENLGLFKVIFFIFQMETPPFGESIVKMTGVRAFCFVEHGV